MLEVTQPYRITLEQCVIRKDGTVEDLGTVAYWHRSWFCRVLWQAEQSASRPDAKAWLRRWRERREDRIARRA